MGRTRMGIAALTASVGLALLVVAPASAAVTPKPTSLKFGSQKVGTQSAVQQVQVFGSICPDLPGPMGSVIPGNCGEPLDVAVSGDFAIVSSNCPPALAGGLAASHCEIGVAFKPTALGPRKGFLRLQSSPSIGGIPLSGPGCKKKKGKGKRKLVCKARKRKK